MKKTFERAADLTGLYWTCARMTVDSQVVIAMRMRGSFGVWSLPKGETQAMISEKVPAFTEAYISAVLTTLSGRGLDRAARAMVEPISIKAGDNRARLSEHGPRRFAPETVSSHDTDHGAVR